MDAYYPEQYKSILSPRKFKDELKSEEDKKFEKSMDFMREYNKEVLSKDE